MAAGVGMGAAGGLAALGQESVRFFQTALRCHARFLSDEEWEFWLGELKSIQAARAGERHQLPTPASRSTSWRSSHGSNRDISAPQLQGGRHGSTSRAGSSGGAADIPKGRVRREAAVKALDESLSTGLRAGRVKEEEGERREVLADGTGERVQWIKGNCIDKGAFGEVFRAQLWSTMEFVAVKGIYVGGNARSREKLERETRIMARFSAQQNPHPNVVRYYGREEHGDGWVYLVMEYCPEGHLRSLVHIWKSREPTSSGTGTGVEVRGAEVPFPVLPLNFVKLYTAQLAAALEQIHAAGILHRDIKSKNILIADNGQCVKLADFGEAIKTEDYGTSAEKLSSGYAGCGDNTLQDRELCGSLGHQAPEVFGRFSGKEVVYGPGIDVWSLGCVVFEMLTGREPETTLQEKLWPNRQGAPLDAQAKVFYLCRRVKCGDELAMPFRDLVNRNEVAFRFLEGCFASDPQARPSTAVAEGRRASELRSHPFLTASFSRQGSLADSAFPEPL